MIKTISRTDFAEEILSRYTPGTPGQIPGADLLFATGREEAGGETPLARSIQNIWMVNRAITENTVLNLHIHLDFLYSVLQKTMREIHQNAARHIAMLDKSPAAAKTPAAETPRPAGVLPGYAPRQIPADHPFARSSPAAGAAQPGQPEALPLVFPPVPNIEATSPGKPARPQPSGRKAASLRDAASATPGNPPIRERERTVRPADSAAQAVPSVQAAPTGAASQHAGKTAVSPQPESAQVPPPESLAAQNPLHRQPPFAALSLATLSVSPWLRELWQIGIIKPASNPGNPSAPPTGWPERSPEHPGAFSQAARVLPTPPDSVPPPQTQPPETQLPRTRQTRAKEELPPAFPRRSPLTPSSARNTEQPGATHQTLSPLYPGEAQTALPMQPAERQLAPGMPHSEPSGVLPRGREPATPPVSPLRGIPGKPQTMPETLSPEHTPGGIPPARMEMRKTDSADLPARRATAQTTPAAQEARTPAAPRIPAAQEIPAVQEIPHAQQPSAAGAQPHRQSTHIHPQNTPAEAHSTAQMPHTNKQTTAAAAAVISLPRKAFPTDVPPRKGSAQQNRADLLLSRAARLLPRQDGNHTPAPGDSAAQLAVGHFLPHSTRADSFGAVALPLSHGMPLAETPAMPARAGETTASFPARTSAFLHPQARVAPGSRAGNPTPLAQLLPPSEKQAAAAPSPASSLPGAAIVYRKEQPSRPEQPPIPPAVSHDIEFIKKTVKRTGTTTRTVQANTAVNLPGSGTNADTRRDADITRDLDRQVNAIADKVYSALERRLRSEQMRKGLL